MSDNNYSARVTYEDLVKEFMADKPNDVDGQANRSAMYYRDWMLRKIFSIFKIEGIPEGWDLDYMLTHLWLDGYFCITDTSMGVLPLQTGITGHNVFNHPTTCIIANVVLGSFQRTIDVDCTLVKIAYNYTGMERLLDRYAYLLAACDSGIAVNIMNTKATFIGEVKSKTMAETYKKMYDQITCGSPAVFYNNADGESTFYLFNTKQSFIADDLQELKRNIINEFLTEIGINNANLGKRERLITDEVNANNEEIYANIDHWLTNIREGFNKANAMFGLNLRISKNDFNIKEGGIADESDQSDEL